MQTRYLQNASYIRLKNLQVGYTIPRHLTQKIGFDKIRIYFSGVVFVTLYNTATGAVEYYHPTFLYESLWNFVGFLLLHFLSKKRKYDGQVALGYVAWYGLGRAFIEGLRMDSLYWGPFRVSQVLAGISCVVAVAVLLWQGFRPHDPAKMLVNQAKEAKSEEAPKTEDETHENEG